MQKICFRADAGAEIGYGHFIRTLALADVLKEDSTACFDMQSKSEYQREGCGRFLTKIDTESDRQMAEMKYKLKKSRK